MSVSPSPARSACRWIYAVAHTILGLFPRQAPERRVRAGPNPSSASEGCQISVASFSLITDVRRDRRLPGSLGSGFGSRSVAVKPRGDNPDRPPDLGVNQLVQAGRGRLTYPSPTQSHTAIGLSVPARRSLNSSSRFGRFVTACEVRLVLRRRFRSGGRLSPHPLRARQAILSGIGAEVYFWCIKPDHAPALFTRIPEMPSPCRSVQR